MIQFPLLVLCYLGWHWAFFKLTRIPEEAYFAPSIIVAALRSPGTASLIGLIALFCLSTRKRLRWEKLDADNSIRYFVTFVALVIAWAFSTYDYNLYYGQGHYLARVLIVALALLIFRSPLFVAPLLCLAIVIVHQFAYPLGGYTWTDKRVLFNVLILYQSFLCLRLVTPVRSHVFVYAALCLHAANYFIPGLAKLTMGWPLHEQLHNLFIASYLNDWLGCFRQEDMLALAGWLEVLNFPMVLGALVIELAALFILTNKRACIAILVACTLLHLAIYLASGILFWKWALLNGALVVLVARADADFIGRLFTRRGAIVSVAVIACSSFYFKPIPLAWHDTSVNDSFRLEVVGQSGRIYKVPRTFMAPYDTVFSQNQFQYLSNEKFLVGVYGSTASAEVARQVGRVTDIEELDALSRAQGQVRFDAERATDFDRFVRTFFRALNRTKEKRVVPDWMATPHHIQSFAGEGCFAIQEDVLRARVVHVRSHYHDGQIDVIRTATVREVDIE